MAIARARAFEPVAQERDRQLRSQATFDTKAMYARRNMCALPKQHGRQAKMAALPGGYSVNRKVNRNC